MNPILSCVTVCLNDKKNLVATLDSLIEQTYNNFEVIVVDGASSDGSIDIIKNYQQKFLKKKIPFKFISEKDKGIFDAMNKGIFKASGEWIIFMNAGDTPAAIDTFELIFKNNEYKSIDVLYGNSIQIYPNGKKRKNKGKTADFFSKGMVVEHQGILTRTDLLKTTPYETTYRIAADYAWYSKAYTEKKVFLYLDIDVCNFDKTGISSIELYKTYLEVLKIRDVNGLTHDKKYMITIKKCVWFCLDRLKKFSHALRK